MTSPLVEELWRPRDEESAQQLQRAALAGDLAAALLAIEGADAPRRAAARDAIDALGEQALLALASAPAAGGPQAQASTLRGVLRGFEGDRDDYHAPRNSHLSQVIERRRGLPLLLSVIWMVVGEEAGVEVQGIGLPGHFLVRVGGDDGVLVDPFSGGQTIDPAACRRVVQRMSNGSIPWSDDYLLPVAPAELLERALRNLINAHTQARDPASLYRTARLWSALRPGLAEPQRLVREIEGSLALRSPRDRAN